VRLLHATAQDNPYAIALVQGDLRVSYEELVALIESVALDLQGKGVAQGQLVAVRVPNSIACIVLTYAIWRCGAAVMPIAAELTAMEVESIVEHIRPHFLISECKSGSSGLVICPRINTAFFIEKCAGNPDGSFSLADLAFVRFTSGTTGAFKGVALCHLTIVDRITALNRVLQISSDDTVVWVLSMAHHFVSTIVLYLTSGATIVLSAGMPGERILDAVEKEKATIVYAAPFHYGLMAADTSNRSMPSIRLAISTAVSLPESVYTHFYNRFGLPVRQAYGIIETGLVCVNTAQPFQHIASVGQVVSGYEIEIRDSETPSENGLPLGRIFVRGPGFFDAYCSPFRSADHVLDNGWFDTGDIGRVDSDGFVYILGRCKDVINIAGMKVFPQEVEQVLNEHPGVCESRVFSIDSTRQGETVAAEVVLCGTESMITQRDLRSYCRCRLAAYKIPETIRFVDCIAKTAVTLKIIRQRSGADAIGDAEGICRAG
jgi:long-chain acyl-CoA synthetase